MNIYVASAITFIILTVAFLLNKFKKMTFVDYTKKYDDL